MIFFPDAFCLAQEYREWSASQIEDAQKTTEATEEWSVNHQCCTFSSLATLLSNSCYYCLLLKRSFTNHFSVPENLKTGVSGDVQPITWSIYLVFVPWVPDLENSVKGRLIWYRTLKSQSQVTSPYCFFGCTRSHAVRPWKITSSEQTDLPAKTL